MSHFKPKFIIIILSSVIITAGIFAYAFRTEAQTPKCWVYAPLNAQANASVPVTVYYENMNFNVNSAKIECGDKTSNDETAKCGKNKQGSCIDYCKYKKEGGPYSITAYVKGSKSSERLTCGSGSIIIGSPQQGNYIQPSINWTCRDSDPTNNKNIYGEVMMTSNAPNVGFTLKDQCGMAPKNNTVVQYYCKATSGNDQLLYNYTETPCASDEKCENGRCVALSGQPGQEDQPVTWPSLLENDLVIEEVVFENNSKANSPLAFLIKTKNVGTKRITTNFYYRVIDAKTNNTICSHKNTVNINAGQSINLFCSAPQGLSAGQYNLRAEVDYTNSVKKDTNRSNNQKAFSLKIVAGETAAQPIISTSNCNYNGVKDNNEECDGFDFGGATCQTKGFKGGALYCSQCKITTSNCSFKSSSGNDFCSVLDPGEIAKGQSKEISVQFKGFNPYRILYQCDNNTSQAEGDNKSCDNGTSGNCRVSCAYDKEGTKNFTAILYSRDNIMKAMCQKQITVSKETVSVGTNSNEVDLTPKSVIVYNQRGDTEPFDSSEKIFTITASFSNNTSNSVPYGNEIKWKAELNGTLFCSSSFQFGVPADGSTNDTCKNSQGIEVGQGKLVISLLEGQYGQYKDKDNSNDSKEFTIALKQDTAEEPKEEEPKEEESVQCEAVDQCGYTYNASLNQCVQFCVSACYNPYPFKTQEQCENAYPITKAEKQQVVVPLKKGWNQISVPISNPVTLISRLKECKIQEILDFNPARVNNEWLKPVVLDPLKGYFILVEDDCALNFEGYRLPKSRILAPGWNMVSSTYSWKNLDPNNKCGVVDPIFHFNPEKYNQDPNNSYDEISQDEPLDDTQGYWINIKNRCVIKETATNSLPLFPSR